MAAATYGYGYFPPPTGDPTSFASLEVEPWRQFNEIKLDLSNRLTVITGTNGTGKTTLLNLIGVHFNWPSSLIGTPKLDKGVLSFTLGTESVFEMKLPDYAQGVTGYPDPPKASIIGHVQYENDIRSEIVIPEIPDAQLTIAYENQQNVEGLYLNSHRSSGGYQNVSWIPAKFSPARELLESFINEVRSTHIGSRSEKSSMLIMKESLLAASLYSEGNGSVTPDAEAHAVWHGFQEVLRKLLPEELGFQKLQSSPPEIILFTSTGNFTFDALSGGLRAVFEMAWQIFLRSYATENFTVCIDEPENHLHPALQRSLVPNLLSAFPNVKFIIATHSPFVVRSTNESCVYGLRYASNGRVSAELLDLSRTGLQAEDILKDALGLESTVPIWAESEFNKILSEFSAAQPTTQTISLLKKALLDAGLSTELPMAIDALVETITVAEHDL